MVTYNSEDFNLSLICDRLKDLGENNSYYIYGLKKESLVHIEFKWKDEFIPIIFNRVLCFMDFCFYNKLAAQYKRNENFKTKKQLKNFIHIGLNYKLREYPELCALLIKSFIYLNEEKIKPENFMAKTIIKNMPKFED